MLFAKEIRLQEDYPVLEKRLRKKYPRSRHGKIDTYYTRLAQARNGIFGTIAIDVARLDDSRLAYRARPPYYVLALLAVTLVGAIGSWLGYLFADSNLYFCLGITALFLLLFGNCAWQSWECRVRFETLLNEPTK